MKTIFEPESRMVHLKQVKRVVVKIGTSLSWDAKKGLNPVNLKKIVSDIVTLKKQGLDVVLVTSGAIGAGMLRLGMNARPASIPQKQATAAVGQVYLMDLYESLFSKQGLDVAQLLLTREDTNTGSLRRKNARNTLLELLKMNVVPIINENDTVVVEEIKFGDNDRLGALVANLVDAELLIILTDVDGLYDQDPRKNKKAKRICHVTRITRELEKMAGGVGSLAGTGGMVTKLQAGKLILNRGRHMVIACGTDSGVLARVFKGEDVGTFFEALPRKKGAGK